MLRIDQETFWRAYPRTYDENRIAVWYCSKKKRKQCAVQVRTFGRELIDITGVHKH